MFARVLKLQLPILLIVVIFAALLANVEPGAAAGDSSALKYAKAANRARIVAWKEVVPGKKWIVIVSIDGRNYTIILEWLNKGRGAANLVSTNS